jgi:hypothetical protein
VAYKDPAKARAWREKNKQRLREYHKQWVSENRERVNGHKAVWSERNPDYVRPKAKPRPAYNRAFHARNRKVMPAWADRAAILKFYEECPAGMHVDHVIPRAAKTVTGLHVLANLQYLTPEDNRSKRDSY